mgnify:CR=1 FL=1
MRERLVTFTVLEDGLYLPSVGGVLPEGEYRGRIEYDDAGKLRAVFITIPGKTLADMGVDRGGVSLNWNIINDYRSQLIGEDRED